MIVECCYKVLQNLQTITKQKKKSARGLLNILFDSSEVTQTT